MTAAGLFSRTNSGCETREMCALQARWVVLLFLQAAALLTCDSLLMGISWEVWFWQSLFKDLDPCSRKIAGPADICDWVTVNLATLSGSYQILL